MPGYSCPQCRGELVDDLTNAKWYITFSTTTTAASGIDPDSFAIDVLMSDSSHHQQSLASNSGTADGNGRTEYEWSISRPGAAVSGVITCDHGTLGELGEELEVSQQGSSSAA